MREAHEAVGALVRQSEESGVELHAWPYKSFKATHASFGADVFGALSAMASVERLCVPSHCWIRSALKPLLGLHQRASLSND